MQIEALKVFADLAETESFTKAAQLNEVTQSAVSQQITALERHFETPLIERSRKKFRLTREGEVLYQYAKQILGDFSALKNRITEIKDLVSGSIRVSTIYSIGLHELPPYVRQFLKTHPTVNIQVEYRRVNQVYEDVLSNTVDLGLLAYAQSDPRLSIIPLREDPMVLICHPHHKLAAKSVVALPELNGAKFVAFEPDIPTRQAIDKALHSHGADVELAMELDNIETVKRAVEIDAGIAIVPRNTILDELSRKSLAEVQLANGGLARPLAVIHRSKKALTPAMKEFIGMLKGDAMPAKPKRKKLQPA